MKQQSNGMTIDDFAHDDLKSSLGTRWRAASDILMGGKSEASVRRDIVDGRPCLRLRDDVRLENNGGFIQAVLGYASGFSFFWVVILLVCLVRLFWPPFDRFLIPFDGLWHPAVLLTGDALLAVGFAAAIGVHFFMGEQWRSGTRDSDRIQLIATGPFAYSRNPLMLCVMAAQVGLFCAMPSVFTLICLIVGW